jgi:hypothetical protein
VVLVVRGAGGAWCWWCVVLVVRGAGGAWCWWCVVLVVRGAGHRRGPDRTESRPSSCRAHIYAQFVICRVYLTFSFAMQEP